MTTKDTKFHEERLFKVTSFVFFVVNAFRIFWKKDQK